MKVDWNNYRLLSPAGDDGADNGGGDDGEGNDAKGKKKSGDRSSSKNSKSREDDSDDEGDPAGKGSTVSKAAFDKAMAELNDLKTKQTTYEEEKRALKEKEMRKNDDFKGLLKLREDEIKSLHDKNKNLTSGVVQREKMAKIREEASKQGLIPEALSDLNSLKWDHVVGAPDENEDLVFHGVSAAITSLKQTKPHWFKDATKNINPNLGKTIKGSGDDGKITTDDVIKAEQEAKKSGDKSNYYKIHEAYRKQEAQQKIQ